MLLKDELATDNEGGDWEEDGDDDDTLRIGDNHLLIIAFSSAQELLVRRLIACSPVSHSFNHCSSREYTLSLFRASDRKGQSDERLVKKWRVKQS